jgi:soluble lytic murein transglycosylase
MLAIAVAVATPARADDASLLGDAFRAYDASDLAKAQKLLAKIDDSKLANTDYVAWLRGMVDLRTGEPDAAETQFKKIGKGSRFAPQVAWRLADCAWARGDRAGAAKDYARLVKQANADEEGDVGTAMYRIAVARKDPPAQLAAYRELAVAHPAHPLAQIAEQRLAELGAPPLTTAERVERARHLTDAHLWDEAVVEIASIGDNVPPEVARQRDYWLGITLFKMRRRYGDAAKLLLGVYKQMGASAAEAMFHGARALSRADRDDEAIAWYHKVVAEYPSTPWAAEAQYLSGWLEFNREKWKAAIGPLEDSLARYPHSKFADNALWFLGMSHYMLGEWDAARARLEQLAKRPGALDGGKGSYWLARIDERLSRKPAATAGYTDTVKRHPFSWYALLARARLKALGVDITPFGGDVAPHGPKLADKVDDSLASDPLIQRADELLRAKLGTDAGFELARAEKAFLKRHDHGPAFAMLLDRYRKAGNANRPWMLAVSYSGTALDSPPDGDAKRWWENAYPRAYRELIDKFQALGDNPEDYLYSIMRKESGFDPHDISFADAQGLLQMIPPTTERVAKVLGVPYDDGKLYEPAYNIQTGSWYIGHLLTKFKRQIPVGAGSFNSGPRPVMKWLDQHGDQDIDVFVELVPFTETREYMKKVTENYARYRFLYHGEVYDQPLTVDKHYVVDQLTY